MVKELLRPAELLERLHRGRREHDDAITLDTNGLVSGEDEGAGARDAANADFGIVNVMDVRPPLKVVVLAAELPRSTVQDVFPRLRQFAVRPAYRDRSRRTRTTHP
jgi:hypothetical protein